MASGIYEEAWRSLEGGFRNVQKQGMLLSVENVLIAMECELGVARQRAKEYQEKIEKELEEGYKEMAKGSPPNRGIVSKAAIKYVQEGAPEIKGD